MSVVFSIAASQILLGLAIVAAWFSGERKTVPYWRPAMALLAWTLVSAIATAPAAAWPQVRKFYIVFGLLFAVGTSLRSSVWLLRTLGGILAAATLSSVWSFVQFGRRVVEARELGVDFYSHYVGQRTTGFMSHWMTFSGEMLVGLVIAISFVFFSARPTRERILAAVAAALLAIALLLNQTRSIWVASVVCALYLVAVWRPKWLVAVPLVGAAAFFAAPEPIQQRALSIVQPHGETDSNSHRIVCWRTGWEMVKAHPVTGVGPEQVGKRFLEFVPPDIPKPLPEGWYGHVHSVFLQFAAERGVPCLALLVWLMIASAADCMRALRRPVEPVARFVIHAALAVSLGTAVSGIFEHNLGNSEILHLYIALSACGWVAARLRSGVEAA